MAATVEDSKISTGEVVAQTLNAVEHGQEEVITDDWARGAKDSLPNDLTSMYADL